MRLVQLISTLIFTLTLSSCAMLNSSGPAPAVVVDDTKPNPDRGDVNLNGIAFEIADAVVFTNYFVEGLGSFNTNPERQMLATEMNGDGDPLTVADLVYLIRIIQGDPLPLPKLFHGGRTSLVQQGSVISTANELGAALFIFEGNVDVTLLADGVDLRTGMVEGNTHALVYNLEGNSILAGEVVAANALLLSVEAASVNGAVLAVENSVLPTQCAVGQNYPNPFNPKTRIPIDFAQDSPYRIEITDAVGRTVEVISGNGSAGTLLVKWDASEFRSGVYSAHVTVCELDVVIKMTLLK